ncbi:MAG: chromophore lyase CpcT/CpeT [Gammaproteobacteria bacterium]|nr:chromophore lyase CpcT/CpeT [Gammaproteobacteria bacterium]
MITRGRRPGDQAAKLSVCLVLLLCAGAALTARAMAAPSADSLVSLLEGRYQTTHDSHSPDAPQLTDHRVRVENSALGTHVLYWQLNSGPGQRVYRQRLLVIEPDPASGQLRQRTYSFAEPARFADQFDNAAVFAALTADDLVSELPADCDPMWRQSAEGWRSYVDPARCRIFSTRHQDYRHIEAELQLTPEALRQTERGFDAQGQQLFGTPPGEMLELRRVR